MSQRRPHIRYFLLRWAGRLSVVLVALAVIAGFNLWHFNGYEILSVQSGSMAPLISKGDAVFIRKALPADIQVGDIVSYPNPAAAQELITHRVVYVDPVTGRVLTAGDANQTVDPSIDATIIAGVVHGAIPKAGLLIDLLHSWQGLTALVYLPAGIVLVQELRRVIGFYSRPTYKLCNPNH